MGYLCIQFQQTREEYEGKERFIDSGYAHIVAKFMQKLVCVGD
jgi:hypothetical protein